MNEWEERIYDREDARQEGLKEGMQKGVKEGMQKGIKEGVKEERRALICKLKSKLSDEEIAELTELPIEEIRAVKV